MCEYFESEMPPMIAKSEEKLKVKKKKQKPEVKLNSK